MARTALLTTTVSASLVLLSTLTAPAQMKTVCTFLIEAHTERTLLEEGDCASRVTPASTFKIPLAIMAYDAGILNTPHDPVMKFRTGDPDWGGDNWKRDTTPEAWMRHSVLWYSQRITRALGADSLTNYARRFAYGNADFSGDTGFDNGLERAWISSSLRISPREQAAFLKALVLETLPADREAMSKARSIVEASQIGSWTLHGKTGGAYPRRADRSFDYEKGWGWYVGWATNGEKDLIFVSLAQATKRFAGSPGPQTRAVFLHEWPRLVGQP